MVGDQVRERQSSGTASGGDVPSISQRHGIPRRHLRGCPDVLSRPRRGASHLPSDLTRTRARSRQLRKPPPQRLGPRASCHCPLPMAVPRDASAHAVARVRPGTETGREGSPSRQGRRLDAQARGHRRPQPASSSGRVAPRPGPARPGFAPGPRVARLRRAASGHRLGACWACAARRPRPAIHATMAATERRFI